MVGGAVYASDGGSAAFLVGVDAETGETLFKQRGVPKATLVAVGDKLLVLDEEGALRLAAPGQGRIDELGRAEVLGSQAWTVPTLVGRRVFVRDSRRLVALELP